MKVRELQKSAIPTINMGESNEEIHGVNSTLSLVASSLINTVCGAVKFIII
jgi:hypothetical protein